MENIMKKVKLTMDKSHSSATVNVYHGYVRAINKWYVINHPSIVDFTKIPPEIDRKRLRATVDSSAEGLTAEFKMFCAFIKTRKHSLLKDKNNKAAGALVGSLNGYRSAFNWFIWTGQRLSVPPQWDFGCKYFWVCLKNKVIEQLLNG